jgi:dTDP-4-amino-4,6-dideoxygalactose transaminase
MTEFQVPFLDLRRQTEAIRGELEQAFAESLDGSIYVLGPALERFEREVAELCGTTHGVGVASGTDAIALALRGVGVGAGDEVITVANTCVPTVVGIELAGATPVLADASSTTWTLDPASVAAQTTSRTKAILPVHLYGRLADVDALGAQARERGLILVEDAAQAHGAHRNGVVAGSSGLASAMSFYPTKNLGALGDGGAVVTSDDEVAARVRSLRVYGERARYESVDHGVNSRLDSLQAAFLSVKLRRLAEWNERRRRIATYYLQEIEGAGLTLPAADEGSAWHLFVVLHPARDAFRERLAARGVATLVHYPTAVHEQPAYRHLGHAGLEVSERLCREVVSLPLFPELTDAEVEHVAAAVRAAA